MLRVEKLSKRYGSRTVLDEVTFTVERGEAFCLLGANGAGKTTTLNLLLGFVPASGGQARLGEADLLAGECARRLVYVPENVALYPEFDAIENVQYLAAIAAITVKTAQIADALQAAGLDPAFHRTRLGQFSKGMRQKVALAFALLKRAELVILDEPTSGLDPLALRDFLALVATLKQRQAVVLMVTHDLQCAHIVADRIAVLRAGRLAHLFDNRGISLKEIERVYFGEALFHG